MIEKNLTSAGARIKRARIIAGIATRRQFEEQYNISSNTLQGWEQGKNPLSLKGAKRIVEALKAEGLICSTEWLMTGEGMPPRAYEMVNAGLGNTLLDNEQFIEQNLKEEQIIYAETQLFKKCHPGSVVITISDDSLEPYFSIGDTIGGIQISNENISKYVNRRCILELENNLILPRVLQMGKHPDRYTVCSTNPNTLSTPLNLYNVKVISVAPIIWHRKKMSSLQG